MRSQLLTKRAIQESNLWPLAPELPNEIPALNEARDTGVEPVAFGSGDRSEVSTNLSRLSQIVATVDCHSGIGHGTDSNRPKPSQPFSEKPKPFGPPVVQAPPLRSVRTLLTVRDAAAALRLSTATVYNLCKRGELPHVRVSNAIRIAPADLATLGVRVAVCSLR